MVLKGWPACDRDHQNGRLPATYGKGACCTTSAATWVKKVPQHRSTKAVNNPDFHFAQVSQEYDFVPGRGGHRGRNDRPHLLSAPRAPSP